VTEPAEVSVLELAAASDDGALVVDVREPGEYVEGHVPQALLMPLRTVPDRYQDLPKDRTVYLVCTVGARSMQAAYFLAELGYDVRNVAGGTRDWIAAGLPVETGPD
jgi:rhodanese-related sulfurtransferase